MPSSLRTPSDVPGQALKNFTNREKEKDVLKRVLNTAIGHPLPAVMFYGVGGAGKSWLLKKLRGEHPNLPSALIDLDPRTGGTSDPSKLLAAVRQQFHAVACPRFDTAYAWLRFKEGAADEPVLKGGGAVGEAFEVVKEMVGSSAETPLVGPFLKRAGRLLKKSFDGSAAERWMADYANQPEWQDFLRLRAADTQEIYPQLPRRLLQDLNENLPPVWLGTQCKAVLFLDTMESLAVGVPGSAQRHARSEWVRQLHATDSPVLLVLAGRDKLTWEEVDPGYADRAYLEQHLVGGLSEPDARVFLGKCGIDDRPLQDAVLRVSEDTESEPEDGRRGYHPFSLGLCADTVYVERAAGRTTDPATFDLPPADVGKLAQRFLTSLPSQADQNWVRRLALAPRFDEPAALAAFEAVEGHVSKSAWQTLLGFSFVQDADEPGWRTLHAKMRDALATRPNTAEGHGWWAGHWRERSKGETDDFAGLAWYHGWCLDPKAALWTWNALTEKLRGREMRMDEHRAVLTWWEPTGLEKYGAESQNDAAALNDLGIEYRNTSLGDRAAKLTRALGCFEAALRVYAEDQFPWEWATAQNNLGAAYRNLPSGDRAANLERAIGCYQAALRVYAEDRFPKQWAMTQNNLGIAYADLPSGDRAANLERAIGCYQAALRVYAEDRFPKQWAMTQNNLGITYKSLPTGDRAENLQQSIACHQAALRVHTEDRFPQDWATAQNNLGVAYTNLPSGDRAANLERAIGFYQAALRVYTEDRFPQDWAMTQFNLGLAFEVLAEVESNRHRLEESLLAFENSYRGYNACGDVHNLADAEAALARVRAKLAAPPG